MSEKMNIGVPQYRDLKKDIIVFHNKNEIPFISVPHLHSQYEIYYNISGACGFMVNGEFYKCGERDLIVIPKTWAHKAIVKKNVVYERCIINIDEYIVELTEIICRSPNLLSWLKGSDANMPRMVNLSESGHEEFLSLIEGYNAMEAAGDDLLLFSEFLKLLSFLKRSFENPKKSEYLEEESVSYPEQVMRIIEQSFKTATVADIAARIFVNEDYINRIFKNETGVTVKQYLIMRRLAETKKYLYLGKSAKEACVLSGFRDYANFLRTFKKYEGISPKELEKLTEPL